VSIDVINQAATDNNVKVLKNSTLDKQKEKIIKKLDNDIAKLQTEQLKNPFVGTINDDYTELERQYNEAKQDLENEIQRLRDQNEDLEKNIKESAQDIENSKKARLDNTRELTRIERDNKAKLKNLEDELTILKLRTDGNSTRSRRKR